MATLGSVLFPLSAVVLFTLIIYRKNCREGFIEELSQRFGRRPVPVSVSMRWLPVEEYSSRRLGAGIWNGLTRLGLDADFIYIQRLWPVDSRSSAVAVPQSSLSFAGTKRIAFRSFDVIRVAGLEGGQLLIPIGVLDHAAE